VSKRIERIVLIYDRDRAPEPSAGAGAGDAARVAGATCALCAITHVHGYEKPEWTRRQATLGVPIKLTSRLAASPEELDASPGFPSVIAAISGGYRLLLDRQAIEECGGSVLEFHSELERRVRGQGFRF
jgi:hypothetical protein